MITFIICDKEVWNIYHKFFYISHCDKNALVFHSFQFYLSQGQNKKHIVIKNIPAGTCTCIFISKNSNKNISPMANSLLVSNYSDLVFPLIGKIEIISNIRIILFSSDGKGGNHRRIFKFIYSADRKNRNH